MGFVKIWVFVVWTTLLFWAKALGDSAVRNPGLKSGVIQITNKSDFNFA
jgi:hypothetical protein